MNFQNKSIIINLVLFIIFFAAAAAATILIYTSLARTNTNLLKPFFPKTYFSVANPPSESQVGQIATLSGSVAWESRTSNIAVTITVPQKIQQGEELDTLANGKATIDFKNAVSISVDPNSQVGIIQTLPANLVFDQKQGLVTYTKEGDLPISVRTFDLLTNVDGSAIFSNDPKTFEVEVTVSSGSAKAAYDDLNYNTHVVTVEKGHRFLFNNNTKRGETLSL